MTPSAHAISAPPADSLPAALDVSVVIVNWRSADYVRQCLASIYKFTRDLRFEIIVVDSASFDGCGEMLAREFPAVKFIQSGENLGFGRSNNLGAARALGRNLLLLNPDTELREDAVGILSRVLDSLPGAGALGPRHHNPDGTLQDSCVQAYPTVLNQAIDSEFFRRLFPGWRGWGTAPLTSPGGRPARAEALSGACIMVKAEVFRQVGGFSDHFFMYGEDLDLCFKINRAGYALYHVPQTFVIHFGGRSTGKSGSKLWDATMAESVYRFMKSNRGEASAAAYRAVMAAASAARILLLLPLRLFSNPSAKGPGLEALRKWQSILRWTLGLQPRNERAGMTS